MVLDPAVMRDRLIDAMLKRHNVTLELEPAARFGFRTFPGDQSVARFRVIVAGLIPVGWVYATDGRWFAYEDLDGSEAPLHIGPFHTRYAAVRSIGSLATRLPPDREISI